MGSSPSTPIKIKESMSEIEDFSKRFDRLVKEKPKPMLLAPKVKGISWEKVCDKLRVMVAEIEMNGIKVIMKKRKNMPL